MLRTVRPLRLEPFEDRALPSAPVPAAHPPVSVAAQVSGPAPEADADEAEYANKSKSDTAGSPAPTAVSQVPDYVIAAYPAAPPTPAGPAPLPPPAAAPPPAIPAVPTVNPPPASAGQVPSPPPTTPPPPPTPPSETRPDEETVETVPTPPVGTGDQPAGSDTEFPPVGVVSAVVPFLDNLELRFNLGEWSDAASRLFDGLDAIVGLPDSESPWAKLGYWTLVIGAVGVTVELTRQGLRAKQPEPASGLPLPVNR